MPRPLSTPTLNADVWFSVLGDFPHFTVVISDDSFRSIVARTWSRATAEEISGEINQLLKAARLLAGTQRFSDQV